MKKIFAIIITITIMCLCGLMVSAETVAPETVALETTESNVETITTAEKNTTALPAIEHVINFFFDGKVTVSQIVEYVTIAVATTLSFIYSKYKRKTLLSEKTISKTDVEIEDLKSKNQDMANQLSLLGNMIVCAYLSNNLIDPELKKKLAVYAEELTQNTTINQDKLTEKLILAAQNPNLQEKVTDLKERILKEAEQNQEDINNIKQDIADLNDTINQDVSIERHTSCDSIEQNASINYQASDVIDNLKIGD